jgi:acyl transferase domain-containing protein
VAALDVHLAVGLDAVIEGATDADGALLVDQTEYTQPALFAVEVALASWWQEVGLRPTVLAGHSIGELAAAHVAGVMDLADAARLVCARGALMAACRADGAMASIEATEAEVLELVRARSDRLSIAGLNGPTQTVVSGDADDVADVVRHFDEQGRRTRALQVSRAFHSPHMDAALDGFGEVARSCTFRAPRVPVVSTLTADLLPPPERLADHWVEQLRGPVRFLDAVRRLEDDGVVQYVESGPAPVLSTLAATCVSSEPRGGFVASMRGDRDEAVTLHEAAGAVFAAGADLRWDLVVPWAPSRVPVPGHVFARDRHWATGSGVPARESRRADAWWETVADEDVEGLARMLQVPAADRAALAAVAPYLAGFRRDLVAPPVERDLALEVQWLPVDLEAATVSGRWVVVSSRPGDVAGLARALSEAGAAPADVLPVPDVLQLGLLSDPDVAGVVVDLRDACCDRPGELASSPAVRDALRIAQAVASSPAGPAVWGLTRASVEVVPGEVVQPAAASLWGLSQVAALETDHRWRGLLDLDGPLDDGAASRVASVVASATEEHVALRADATRVRRLVEVDGASEAQWRPAGTVLVTGSGAVAAHLTRWLLQHGADDVVLLSRSGRTVEGADGGRVHARSCDVTDREALRDLLADLDASGLAPRAVVHAAGVLDDRLLPDVDAGSLARVADPKLVGATLLDELTADRDLEAFVLVSSVVGVLGNHGQATYAMANAALDGLAARRRSAGLPATSLAFGPWDGPGMASGAKGDQLRRAGLVPIVPRRALSALSRAVTAGGSAVVAEVAWSEAAAAYGPARHRGLLREIPGARVSTPVDDAPGDLLAELAALPDDARAARALAVARQEVAAVLKVADPSTIDPDRGMKDLGVDSMMAVAISQRLTRRTSVPTPRTITFDRPTVRALGEWLVEQVGDAEPPTLPTAGPRRATVADEAVAVVGVGLRMPGGAHDLDSLWDVLARGVDTVVEVPTSRFGGRSPAQGSGPALASLLDDVDCFDAGFFGISPREAATMDPQHRLLLETAWEALEQAGLVPGSLRGSTTGVFVGTAGPEYDAGSGDLHGLTGRLASFAAGRIAHHLGTQGPTYSLDTACSSSLAAVHLARESLLAGECDLALAGGAQVIADPGMFDSLGKGGALAPDGRSKTFSASADGYGRGEGAAVAVLMRLSDALASGAPVLSVVLGSAVMHDGTSSGITAPNGASQQRVIRRALEVAGIRADSVDYVECHGTGTALGDPVEVNALAAAYGPRDGAAPLRLGTAKSVIGHLEAAAGIAGLCKVLASLRHGALPATRHSSPRNPHLDWQDLGVEVVDELAPWPADGDRPRRAGISAFGLSGTNVHLLVEQAPIDVPTAPTTPNDRAVDLREGESR